jgi:hypothetical protein
LLLKSSGTVDKYLLRAVAILVKVKILAKGAASTSSTRLRLDENPVDK